MTALAPITAVPGELLWLAGLLEGEGYFGRETAGRGRMRAVLRVKMTDRDVIERAARALGGSSVVMHRPPSLPAHHKTTFRTKLVGRRAEEAMQALLPHMGGRRSACIRAVLSENVHAL